MTENTTEPATLEPAAVWEMMQSNPAVLLVDVRSDMEFLMIGHPKGAKNVSWIDHPDWTINPNFVSQVRKLLLGRLSAQQNAPLVLICRSGNRSLDAAKLLLAEGMENVSIVADGFEGPLDNEHHRNTVAGWRFRGLPWEQC